MFQAKCLQKNEIHVITFRTFIQFSDITANNFHGLVFIKFYTTQLHALPVLHYL
jgi:hypothetical protein